MKKDTTIEIICGLLILLFVYTALSKLLAYRSFTTVLGKSPLIQGKAALVAWLLPTIELIASALLLMPSTRKMGLYASFFLMLLFTLYIAYMLLFTQNLPCSCGGAIGRLTWKQHLVFNILFTALAFVGARLHGDVAHKGDMSDKKSMPQFL